MQLPLDHPLYVLAVLGLLLAVSEWCVRRTPLRHLGSALLVILLAAVAVNLAIIPPAGQKGVSPPVFDALLGPVAQLAVFWLLLEVNFAELRRAGGALVGVFLLGSLGTLVGVVCAFWLVVEPTAFGEHRAGVGAMFVGTYTGGSVNFVALAEEYGLKQGGSLLLTATAVDNLMTTLWMVLTLFIPRFFGAAGTGDSLAPLTGQEEDTESVHPLDLGLLLALGGVTVWFSEPCAEWLSARIGATVPDVLVLTTIALVAAQVPVVRKLRGNRVMGMTCVYLFLAAIGALCDVSVLGGAGELVRALTLMVVVALAIHGLVVFGVGRLFRVSPVVLSVASQANVGGGTSALALARSLGRADLVLPAILVGSLGTALGNYLGVLAGHLLS